MDKVIIIIIYKNYTQYIWLYIYNKYSLEWLIVYEPLCVNIDSLELLKF